MTPCIPAGSTSTELISENQKQGIRVETVDGPWEIVAEKFPILNAQDIEAASSKLTIPLPEITFGHNTLIIKSPFNFALEWHTLDALKAVGLENKLQVKAADVWNKSELKKDLEVVKPYDWTYTTLYSGSVVPPNLQFTTAPENHPGIPLHLLARTEIPILFYHEIPLFEDELGDFGVSELNIRVRVNSFSFFLLSRLFLRIDQVLFRTYDIRVYHQFGSKEIIKQTTGRQARYEAVKQFLPRDGGGADLDLTMLTNSDWVANILAKNFTPESSPTKTTTTSIDNLPARLQNFVLDDQVKWEGSCDLLQVLNIS